MLDLHCHILPGVDDGAAPFGEALAMARFCVNDGITHVVATSHCHRHCRMLRADVLPHVALLNEELVNADIRLVILPGSEIQVTDVAAYRREFEAGLYCHLGDSHTFTLLELPWNGKAYPPDAPELVRWIRSQGMTPILAHPERHRYFADDPQCWFVADDGALQAAVVQRNTNPQAFRCPTCRTIIIIGEGRA